MIKVYELILFYPYHIIEALFSRLNLRFPQKNYSYLIFLTVVEIGYKKVILISFSLWSESMCSFYKKTISAVPF